jgi:hypothetical protein
MAKAMAAVHEIQSRRISRIVTTGIAHTLIEAHHAVEKSG